MKSSYDPKLREAAKEFTELCKKYDCIGSVLFVSPTHAEYVNELEASWSVMRLEPQSDGSMGIHFRSKRADFASKEAQHFATEATAHALTSLVQNTERNYIMWRGLLDKIQSVTTLLYRVWDDKPDSIPGDGK